MTDEKQRAEHLLSRGHPGGPRLDQLWEQIAPNVVETPRRRPVWQRLLAWTAPIIPVAAALAFWIGRPVDKATSFTERGTSAVPPQLEATCGTPGSPCRVGQPVYLRVLPRHAGGVVYIRLIHDDGRVPVAGPLPVQADEVTAVPARLVPDEGDVPTGLRVEAVWLASAPLEPGAVDAAPPDARSALHLVVAP